MKFTLGFLKKLNFSSHIHAHNLQNNSQNFQSIFFQSHFHKFCTKQVTSIKTQFFIQIKNQSVDVKTSLRPHLGGVSGRLFTCGSLCAARAAVASSSSYSSSSTFFLLPSLAYARSFVTALAGFFFFHQRLCELCHTFQWTGLFGTLN